jgi:hypothetical protein
MARRLLVVLIVATSLSFPVAQAASGALSVAAWHCPPNVDPNVSTRTTFAAACSQPADGLNFTLTVGEIERNRITKDGKPVSWPSVGAFTLRLANGPSSTTSVVFCVVEGVDSQQAVTDHTIAGEAVPVAGLTCDWYLVPQPTPTKTPEPTDTPTPAPTSTLAPSPTATSTPTATPEPPTFYPLMPEVPKEASSVGIGQFANEVYRSGETASVEWDGEGRIVLSGCVDDACDFSVDDALRLYIGPTRPDASATPAIDLALHGDWSPALDVTSRFVPGENFVRLDLVDLYGDSRGTNTAFSLVVLPSSPESPESYELMEFVEKEPSDVGPEQSTDDVYRSGETVVVRWDGTGRVLLSGCPADACDFSIDDAIRLYVEPTPADTAADPAVDLALRGGWSPALDVTDRFASGQNYVRLDLVDLKGDSRGTNTPFYLVIL